MCLTSRNSEPLKAIAASSTNHQPHPPQHRLRTTQTQPQPQPPTSPRAYYTVAHLLQGEDNLNGSRPGPSGVEASAMRDAEWDYVFLQGAYPGDSAVPEAKLAEMR